MPSTAETKWHFNDCIFSQDCSSRIFFPCLRLPFEFILNLSVFQLLDNETLQPDDFLINCANMLIKRGNHFVEVSRLLVLRLCSKQGWRKRFTKRYG